MAAAAAANLASLAGPSAIVGTTAQLVAGAAACALLVGIEVPRRLTGDVDLLSCARGGARLLRRCLPEVACFGGCILFATALRMRGDTETFTDAADIKVWEQIKAEWPVLMGADTLLNLQAMLRLLALLACAARGCGEGRSPLAGMAAVFGLAAMLARGSLNVRTPIYRLEGPLSLGGDLPIACEVAMLPRLAMLSAGSLREAPVAAAAALAGATAFASRHYLNLAEDPSADWLFTLAHVLEILGALAFLRATIAGFFGGGGGGQQQRQESKANNSPAVDFLHFVMPLQQALAAYYFLTAFEPSPRLVGAGRPFCVLILGNLLQLGVYLCASALHVAARVVDCGAGSRRPADDAAVRPEPENFEGRLQQASLTVVAFSV